MASTEVEQSLKNKTTCALRVSIHCEGCKRKVIKLLRSVPGVENIEIERQQQRVVVTGDVSPESLIRKLVKSGKNAELWPEKAKPPEIDNRKTEKEKPGGSQGSAGEVSAVSGKEIKPPATKPENPVEDLAKISKSTAPDGGANGGPKVAVEVKVEEKELAVVEKNEKQTENNAGEVSGNGGGGEGKKKKKNKKKGQNGNIGETSSSSSAPPPDPVTGGGVPQANATTMRTNQIPPRHGHHVYANEYEYPPRHYYTPPPPPVYTVSYNTAHPPVNSYTASYYAAPPPPQSYAYSHYGSDVAPPPPSDYGMYRQQPVDSFEMFSDENPNGCLVM